MLFAAVAGQHPTRGLHGWLRLAVDFSAVNRSAKEGTWTLDEVALFITIRSLHVEANLSFTGRDAGVFFDGEILGAPGSWSPRSVRGHKSSVPPPRNEAVTGKSLLKLQTSARPGFLMHEPWFVISVDPAIHSGRPDRHFFPHYLVAMCLSVALSWVRGCSQYCMTDVSICAMQASLPED